MLPGYTLPVREGISKEVSSSQIAAVFKVRASQCGVLSMRALAELHIVRRACVASAVGGDDLRK